MKFGNVNIGGMSFGSTRIGGAKYGNTIVYSGDTPSVSIPYIRGGVGSYIDTGITADSDTKVVVWARNFNQGLDNNWLFGARDTTDPNNPIFFDLPILRNANAGSVNYDFGGSGVKVTDSWPLFSHYHKYELSADGLYVDDTQVVAGSSETFSTSVNVHLFGYNLNGANTGSILPADICACKIYKGGLLVRDYTPVKLPHIGLYDAVSDTVFRNAGSGRFSFGRFKPDAYTPLEYITCSGAQYFDTGLKGGYAVPWVCVFTPTGTTARNSYPVGAQTTSSSKRCAIGVGNASYINAKLFFNYQTANNNVKSTNTNDYFTNKKIVYVKSKNVATAYVNNAQEGTVAGTSGSSFETDYTLYVGALNDAGTNAGRLIGDIFYCGMGTDRNYVPAKVNGVAGMYDTYNDVFKPSVSGTDFIAGPDL